MPKASNFLVDINPLWLRYIMDLLGLTEEDILTRLNERRKKPLKNKDVFTNPVMFSTLQQVAKLVGKPYVYFLNSAAPPERATSSSILFRKESSTFSVADRKMILVLEDRVSNLNALSKLSDIRLERKLPRYAITDDARSIAYNLRARLYPQGSFNTDRAFLQALMDSVSMQGILVLEHLVPPRLKDKPEIDGCFIAPYAIGIRRQSGAYKREIFTLLHEFAHYLLDSEQMEKSVLGQISSNEQEQWCNVFAFAFLLGEEGYQRLAELRSSQITIDNKVIVQLSSFFHLSRLAIFTHQLFEKVISGNRYEALKNELLEQAIYSSSHPSKGGRAPVPLYSSAEERIWSVAYSEGVIEELELLREFKGYSLPRTEV